LTCPNHTFVSRAPGQPGSVARQAPCFTVSSPLTLRVNIVLRRVFVFSRRQLVEDMKASYQSPLLTTKPVARRSLVATSGSGATATTGNPISDAVLSTVSTNLQAMCSVCPVAFTDADRMATSCRSVGALCGVAPMSNPANVSWCVMDAEADAGLVCVLLRVRCVVWRRLCCCVVSCVW
jgi:hypothetical protein